MADINSNEYQPDEVRAIASFEAIGIFETLNKLRVLSNIAQARLAECFGQNNSIPNGFTALDFLSDAERDEHHILRLSLTICVDEQGAARERIKQRLQSRLKNKKVSGAI